MEDKPFTITSYVWRKDVEDRLSGAGEVAESPEMILNRLSALASFLDRHKLSTRRLTSEDGKVGEDFVLKSTDLSVRGLMLIRRAYVKWQRNAKSVSDVAPLEKALNKILNEPDT